MYAYPLTLHLFTPSFRQLISTDEHWDATFIQRKASDAVHKLLNMSGLSLYHDVTAKPLSAFEFAAWERAMLKAIPSAPGHDDGEEAEKTLDTNIYRHIVTPTESLTVMLTHNEASKANEPTIDIEIRTGNTIQIQVDAEQYQQWLATLTSMSLLGHKERMVLRRPAARPTEDPRGKLANVQHVVASFHPPFFGPDPWCRC